MATSLSDNVTNNYITENIHITIYNPNPKLSLYYLPLVTSKNGILSVL